METFRDRLAGSIADTLVGGMVAGVMWWLCWCFHVEMPPQWAFVAVFCLGCQSGMSSRYARRSAYPKAK